MTRIKQQKYLFNIYKSQLIWGEHYHVDADLRFIMALLVNSKFTNMAVYFAYSSTAEH